MELVITWQIYTKTKIAKFLFKKHFNFICQYIISLANFKKILKIRRKIGIKNKLKYNYHKFMLTSNKQVGWLVVHSKADCHARNQGLRMDCPPWGYF